MKLIRGRAEGARMEQMEATFTGTVWADPLLPATDDVLMYVVYFSPSARTHWHVHQRGQVLHVTSGEGWVAVRGEAPERMRAGDTVWAPPGEEHWHGATDEAFLVHVALSLGQITWLEPVSDGEVGRRGTPRREPRRQPRKARWGSCGSAAGTAAAAVTLRRLPELWEDRCCACTFPLVQRSGPVGTQTRIQPASGATAVPAAADRLERLPFRARSAR